MTPVAVDSLGNLRARHRDSLADSKTGKTGQYKVLIALDTLDGNAANLTLAGRAGIGYLRIDNHILCFYGEEGSVKKEECCKEQHPFFLQIQLHHIIYRSFLHLLSKR